MVGDVTDTQGATAISALQGTAVSAGSPTNGSVLRYNGTNWTAAVPQQSVWLPAGECQNSTVYPSWGNLSAFTADSATFGYRASGYHTSGIGIFSVNGSKIAVAVAHWIIPPNWDGTMTVNAKWVAPSGSGNVGWMGATLCMADGGFRFLVEPILSACNPHFGIGRKCAHHRDSNHG